MRVLSFALALFAAEMVAEAGVCKPSRTTTSQSALTSSVESSTAAVSTTLTETSEVSTGYSASVTGTASSDSLIETSASSTALAEVTLTELVSTTTEEAATTTTQDSDPSVSPGSLIGTGPVADLTLRGSGSRFIPLSFTKSGSTQTLIFNLVSGKLSTGTDNNYLCMTYKDVGVLGPLVLCAYDNFYSAPLKCQRLLSGQLSCSAPNGSCDSSGACVRPNNAALFYQFYVNNAGEGFFGPGTGTYDGFTAIDTILAE
ncbi:hypothetical protein FHETE_6374 [Fusarium heterosporum]|uniref:Uncharacterized protein n=1 Tax=Fusarium heterosporum TaxID=42747 RepID=A0A8H5TAI2_FUSHE|nr:hypothetical protein FHETE_6374 [Fusarium heterosporum]